MTGVELFRSVIALLIRIDMFGGRDSWIFFRHRGVYDFFIRLLNLVGTFCNYNYNC